MTNQIRNPNDEMEFVRYFCLMGASIAGCAACWWAAGASLGLFFGGLFIATFLIPAAVLRQSKMSRAVLGPVALLGLIAAFWLAAVFQTRDTVVQWLETLLVLSMYSLALGGLALILTAIKFPDVFTAAVAIAIGLAWLTWPVWLSTDNAVVQTLAIVHPPLVINGVLTSEPAWTERSIAYHLTNLNQDVPLQLPDNPWPCATVHGIIAIVFWLTAKSIGQRTPAAVSC
jgi:hypothetical protein